MHFAGQSKNYYDLCYGSSLYITVKAAAWLGITDNTVQCSQLGQNSTCVIMSLEKRIGNKADYNRPKTQLLQA